MDRAETFKPRTILVWRKVEKHPEAARIVGMFPQAQVEVVDRQRLSPSLSAPGSGHLLAAGKRILMIGEASSFLRPFDGDLGGRVCCAPYFKLVPISNGCPYYCTYCYLAYVYRDYHPFIKINVNHERMFQEIRKALCQTSSAATFNMGEMLDSLALDHVSLLTERLVPFFGGLSRGYLMLLTKSSNIANLLCLMPNPQTVVSWSLNTDRMIKEYEIGAATLEERLRAARHCQEHGYRIRLRVDPGILYDNWRSDYAELIVRALAVLAPENITLGMLRLVPGHLSLTHPVPGGRIGTLKAGLSEKASDGKLRYPSRQRIEFYRFLIDVIRSSSLQLSVGLCRETPEVWSGLNHQCDPRQCNCLVW